MISRWTVVVDRDDLTKTEVLHDEVPALSDGEVLLRVDRVGLTANNVTYGVIGEMIGYWRFFPVMAEGRIHTPAHAAAARAAGAFSVCVGTAITHPSTITGWFVAALGNA